MRSVATIIVGGGVCAGACSTVRVLVNDVVVTDRRLPAAVIVDKCKYEVHRLQFKQSYRLV